MEELAPEMIGPRISFSHDGVVVATAPATTIRSDTSLMSPSSSSSRRRRQPEPEFDFANAAAADVAPADRLFAGGKLLPVPPLPPIHPNSTISGGVKPPPSPPTSYQRRPGSWASPFTRSCSVNSSTTTAAATAAPRSAFSCPAFPLMRSRSAGSAANGGGGFVSGAGGQRPQHKKAYYYGGSRNNGSNSGHGVRVSPVINVPAIGTSMVNVLSYLLCDCGNKNTKNRGFGVNC
uniref:Uncharacterized protein n=1 Tax=Leersia perrieri TaxID=77586 RepID=A0A0D9UWF1_9ORYZ